MKNTFWSFSIILTVFFIFLFPLDSNAGKLELNLIEGEIAYTFFDLTHGEATYIKDSNGETILINTGHSNSLQELVDRLEMYESAKISKLMLTSKQAEYTGNLAYILENYQIDEILLPDALESALVPLLNDFKGEVSLFATEDEVALLDDLQMEVLYIENKAGNDEGSSAFFLIQHDKKLFFMTGANLHVENDLVQKYDLKSTIFKVPDFGSDQATSEILLNEVDPQVAVIFNNGEEPPSSHVLERLEATWIDIYLTDRIGTVLIKSNEEDYDVITIRPVSKDPLHANWLNPFK